MKNFRFLALVAMAAALISCEPPVGGVHVDTTQLSFPGEGGTQVLHIKAGMAWQIEVPADLYWLSVSPKSGSSSAEVTVTVSPNKMKDQSREVELVINYEGSQKRVTVSQEKADGEPVFTLSKNTFDVSADGGEISFTVVSDAADFDFTIVENWIQVVSFEGNRYDGQNVKVNIAANDKKAARTGVISVCTKMAPAIP